MRTIRGCGYIFGTGSGGASATSNRVRPTPRGCCPASRSRSTPALEPDMEPPLNYPPRLPRPTDFRIGWAGAGFIMRACHLVSYPHAAATPAAVASRTVERAREVAERHTTPRVHESVAQLLADTEIEVLDIAVPPDVQPSVIREAVRHKHIRGILAQKPLA